MRDGVIDEPAVFDAAVVADVTGEPGDRAFATVLVSTYRRLLPRRVHRIRVAIAAPDPTSAMDAVLSLKVSSSMVGARRLGELGAVLEGQLRDGDLDAAAATAGELSDLAARTDQALAAFLAR